MGAEPWIRTWLGSSKWWGSPSLDQPAPVLVCHALLCSVHPELPLWADGVGVGQVPTPQELTTRGEDRLLTVGPRTAHPERGCSPRARGPQKWPTETPQTWTLKGVKIKQWGRLGEGLSEVWPCLQLRGLETVTGTFAMSCMDAPWVTQKGRRQQEIFNETLQSPYGTLGGSSSKF